MLATGCVAQDCVRLIACIHDGTHVSASKCLSDFAEQVIILQTPQETKIYHMVAISMRSDLACHSHL